MTAEEIANKYAGKIVRCRLTKSTPVDGIAKLASGGQAFDARVIGWKKAIKGEPEFVAVEIQPPGKTKFLVGHFKSGYIFTYAKRNTGAYAKKLYVEEIILPTDDLFGAALPKHIPDYPHKCRDCGSPAQIFLSQIDCSNKDCKHKYRTKSGLDLFLPQNMRPELKTPVAIKKRDYVDAKGFILCSCGNRGINVQPTRMSRINAAISGQYVVNCHKLSCKKRVIRPQQGDKIMMAGMLHEFDGKMTWVKK